MSSTTGVDAEVIERVRAYKAERRSLKTAYEEDPKLAFIVHSFNRVRNVDQLVTGIRRVGKCELIVCEDGSLDGSHERWMSHLVHLNDFLIHSNDLHEIRILDRAIRFSRAEVVCLVQDDDVIPDTVDWLSSAMARFEKYPRLAICGGFMGFGSFHPDPEKAKPVWGPTRFRFVHHVNIGPYFIRRRHYEQLGGWDYSFSEVGEPGICFDNELCLRAWINGYQVGYSFVPFKGEPGEYSLDGGTVLFSGVTRRRNQLRNQDRIFALYEPHTEEIDGAVERANRGIGVRL